MENLFEIFLRQWSVQSIQQAFYQLCVNRGVDPTDHLNVYEKLKEADRFCDSSFKQKQLWGHLDKRRQQKVYQNQTVCRGMNVLIVGAGPCGLRAAIECALLGAHVVVIDSRDKFTRNNVLHLWKFVIEDLRMLGAKVFYPKFCTGSIEHICIRKLQFILLKVALVLGVQFYDKIEYRDLKEPQEDGKGWRAILEPSDHILSNYEFDVIIGASGKQKCLPAFKHNPVRGKLAIGITANFVRHHTKQEDSVPEIQGVAYVYRQDYFDELERKTNIQLENIVYYKSETNYFVMCGKKHNLISKGVIRKDYDDVKLLLSKDNVDMDMLCKYVTQVVDFVTDGKLNQLEFALNARKKPDVAAFDFTTLESADHSSRFVKYLEHPLILTLIGDYLHEPFWPTGSGCARGWLSVMDTAWLLRNVGLRKQAMAQLLSEREGIYSLLSQTQPNNLSNAFNSYTIDPNTRYTRFRPAIPNVEHLMGTDNEEEDLERVVMQPIRQQFLTENLMERLSLFRFCFMAALSKKIRISNFCRSSWADGSALAALISKYNPDFSPSVPITSSCNPATLCIESFAYAERNLGIPRPCNTQFEWATMSESSRIEYLQKLVNVLKANPSFGHFCMSPTLISNFHNDRVVQSEMHARIFGTRRGLKVDNIDPIFNYGALDEISNNITSRQKRQKIENARRSSIEPLNPELIYKIDKIASGSYTKGHLDRKHATKIKENNENGIASQEKSELECQKLEKVNDKIVRDSLAGVNTVSQFRKQFDQESASTTNSTTSSKCSSVSDTSTDEEQQHPADPMHVGSFPSNTVSQPKVQIESSVSFRSATQHQFVSARRPISTPNMIDSPDLHKTFGQRKPKQDILNTAQQQVYRTVSQRRMKLCSLCNGEVYLAEQTIVDDRLCVHKQCFRCAYCNRVLQVGKAHVDRSFVDKFGIRWYCTHHNRKSTDEKLQQLMKNTNRQKSSTAVAIVSPTKLANQNQKRANPAPLTKPSYPEKTFIVSTSTDSSTNSLDKLESIQKELKNARPPTPPNSKRLSSSKYRKRLTDLDSPTQLIAACKQRTDQRLESLGLKNIVDKTGSASDAENDRQSSESFEECEQYAAIEDEEEELLEVGDEFASEDEQLEDDAWGELRTYLETNLSESQIMGDSTTSQARDLIETFNKRSILNHFKSIETPLQQKPSVSDLKTPYFTPRETRADPDVYFTPKTTIIRRSSTLDRKEKDVEVNKDVEQLKKRIEKHVGEVEKPVMGIDLTPQRSNRQRFRRGPRRSTVAISSPADLTEQQKIEQVKVEQIKLSNAQRRRAIHIRPTEDNVERVIKELEAMKQRRKNEKTRQLHAIQRRIHEIQERKGQVYKIGNYLEKSLRKDPRNKWELEQWLSYTQQYEELQQEEKQLNLKLKIFHLEDQYQQLKLQLHTQQDKTMTVDNQIESEKTEKEIMERLLGLLNEKDLNKSLLNDLQSDQRAKTPPADLVKRAPSYTCYSTVFVEDRNFV